jgi:lysophospholipase L1-like esterase
VKLKDARILVFGDSLSHRGGNDAPAQVEVIEGVNRNGSPGDLLASHLLAMGAAACRLDARVGRSAWSFYIREDAAKMLAADNAWNPTHVIIMLGTNDVGLSLERSREKHIALRRAFPGARVIAIGPPSFPEPERDADTAPVVAMLRDVHGAGFIDSRRLTPEGRENRSGDGIHFNGPGAKAYARSLSEAVAGKLDNDSVWVAVLIALGAAILAFWR